MWCRPLKSSTVQPLYLEPTFIFLFWVYLINDLVSRSDYAALKRRILVKNSLEELMNQDVCGLC